MQENAEEDFFIGFDERRNQHVATMRAYEEELARPGGPGPDLVRRHFTETRRNNYGQVYVYRDPRLRPLPALSPELVCVTGPRELSLLNNRRELKSLRAHPEKVAHAVCAGLAAAFLRRGWSMVSGAADGFDRWAARAHGDAGGAYLLALPMPPELHVLGMSRAVFHESLVEGATRVVEVWGAPGYGREKYPSAAPRPLGVQAEATVVTPTSGGGHQLVRRESLPSKEDTDPRLWDRPRLYLERDRWMVQNTQACVGYWSHSGGTRATLQMAKRFKKPHANLGEVHDALMRHMESSEPGFGPKGSPDWFSAEGGHRRLSVLAIDLVEQELRRAGL